MLQNLLYSVEYENPRDMSCYDDPVSWLLQYHLHKDSEITSLVSPGLTSGHDYHLGKTCIFQTVIINIYLLQNNYTLYT